MSTMGPLRAILWAKGRMSRHLLASVRRESKLKVAFVSVSAVLLWIGLFLLAQVGFRLFEDFGAEVLGGGLRLSDLIMGRLLSVFALALLVMLVFSNVLVAFTTLYRSREVICLIQSPIPISTFFLGRFAECVSFSSWASAYLGSPVLLAYGLETGAPPLFYLFLIPFYLPFVTLPAAFGSMLAMFLVRVLARLRPGRGTVVLGLLAVGGVFGYFRGKLRAPDLSETTTLRAVIEAMGHTQSPFLPSHWLTEGLLGAATGDTARALFYLLLLVANALLLVWLAVQVAEAVFFQGWTALQSGEVARPKAQRRSGWLDRGLRFLPQPTRSLVSKDVKLFWRDPAQWSQFVLFFGIMALYVANLRGARVFATDLWRIWGSLLNMTACMLILASLTTRFVFPLISLEGRRFWILGLAPVSLRRIVWQKFALSVFTTAIFTVSLAVLSAVQLGLEGVAWALSIAGIVATTIALSGLAVGLGCLYPNFDEDNPARVVSGLGGTLSFLLSMVYIALVTLAQASVLLWDRWSRLVEGLTDDRYPWMVAAAAGWVAVLTLLTAWWPMRLGLRNLERIEI